MHVQETTSPKPSWWRYLETYSTLKVTALMVLLPIISTFYRALTPHTFTGSIVFVQHLTLWAGFLGALLATGQKKHLSLATTHFFKAGTLKTLADFFASTVAGSVTLMLAYASIIMIQADRLNDGRLFNLIPEWLSEIIMPVALALMALRSAYQAHSSWPGKGMALCLMSLPLMLGLPTQPYAQLTWLLSGLVVAAVLLGAPLYTGMVGLAMVLFYRENTPIATIPAEIFRLVASPTLPAIPLLTLCGFLLAEGGASLRLMRLSRALFGFFPGGIAIMVTVVSALFTTLTGGSGVTIIALGGLMLPILVKEGYPEPFALGLVTAAGSLGLLFPPSLPVILYSVVAEVSANQIFIAGLLPSILLIAMVVLYGLLVGRRMQKETTRFCIRELLSAIYQAKFELCIPLIIGFGIFGGKTTIVEAAAFAALMAFIVEAAIFKNLSLREGIPRVLTDSSALVGSVLIVLGSAMGLTSYLVDAQIPTALLEWVTAHIHSPTWFLLSLNAILLILGSVLEIYSAIVILAPLIVPLGKAFHIDPVHLGIIFLSNLELGFLFPPIGLNLLLSSSRFNRSLPTLYRVSFPFLCLMALSVLIITYWPALSLYLLRYWPSP